MTDLPHVEELPAACTPEAVFEAWSRRRGCIFLDSAQRHTELGRYSFVACEPFDWLECGLPARGKPAGDPWRLLQERLARYAGETAAGLPPFQGGAAGLFSYDLNRTLERIAAPQYDEFAAPLLAVGLYDVVAAFDHAAGRAWLISQGWPAVGRQERRQQAAARLRQFRHWLQVPADAGSRPAAAILPASRLAPQRPTPLGDHVTSCFTREQYLDMVRRGVEYIQDGDIFQVNLSQRLLSPALDEAPRLYHRLRTVNPAPFAAYFDYGRGQVCSASPERFISVRERRVETRPIKGTRRRRRSPEADAFAAAELQASVKDRAENVMIVDLLRNDLSRICEADSVQVTQLCELESYQYVLHLVSAVEARLPPEAGAVDLLRAVFPGGSITGAPKVRAMEIIAELEPTARGPYCGCLGYLGFDGAMDSNILIRTITASGGWWQFPVGGGIVAQSDPLDEFEETWTKARGLIRALTP